MDLKTTLLQRKSTRAFLDKEVPKDIIDEIIDQSKTAPSGVNTQPWQVAVIQGESKNNLCNKFEKAFRDGVKGAMDYKYYPEEWLDEYKKRRVRLAALLNTKYKSRRQREAARSMGSELSCL